GPVLLQALAMLADDDLAAVGRGADYIHLVAEVLNLAFADREAYLGDPRFVDVPLEGLLSREYARARRTLVDPHRAFGCMPEPGDPRSGDGQRSRVGELTPVAARSGPRIADTSYLCVVDAA